MDGHHTILFDARTATRAYPGINRYIRSLLAAMIPELRPDERLHVILPPDTVIPCLEHRSVATYVTDKPVSTFKSHWQTFRLALRIKAQIHHAPYILTPVRVPGKMVLTVHDVIPLSHPQYSTFYTRLFWKFTGRRAIWHSRKLIGVSEDAIKACARFFGPHAVRRSVVIHHGIDPAFHPQTPEAIAEIRRTYQLPEKFLLYVGSDRPHKNVTTLLNALALMDPTASLPLVIAGFNSENSPLRREAEQLNLDARVQWINEIPEEDLPALYCAAHAFLFPSLVEGFGFPVLEAMACGTPVACSRTTSLPEVTGDAAALFDPADPRDIAAVIGALLSDPELLATLRARGLRRAHAATWRACAELTAAAYEAAVAEAPR